MNYPGRYDWGQAVGVQDYTSGDTLNVQGVEYTITFNRWAAGTEVTISPAPTDWGAEPGPTPPVTPTLLWREFDEDESLLVDGDGKVVVSIVEGSALVIRKHQGSSKYVDGGDYVQIIQAWGERELLINQPISIVEVDGVLYTFTSELVVANNDVSISPVPGTFE